MNIVCGDFFGHDCISFSYVACGYLKLKDKDEACLPIKLLWKFSWVVRLDLELRPVQYEQN